MPQSRARPLRRTNALARVQYAAHHVSSRGTAVGATLTNPKLQVRNPKEAPNPKAKCRTWREKGRQACCQLSISLGIWNLELPWDLELGAWDLLLRRRLNMNNGVRNLGEAVHEPILDYVRQPVCFVQRRLRCEPDVEIEEGVIRRTARPNLMAAERLRHAHHDLANPFLFEHHAVRE